MLDHVLAVPSLSDWMGTHAQAWRPMQLGFGPHCAPPLAENRRQGMCWHEQFVGVEDSWAPWKISKVRATHMGAR